MGVRGDQHGVWGVVPKLMMLWVCIRETSISSDVLASSVANRIFPFAST